MKKDTKQRLFEVMGRLDPSFKRLNENVDNNLIRSTNTDTPEFDKNRKYQQNSFKPKPIGLWYEINNSWKDWCQTEMPHRIESYDIILDIDLTDLIILDSVEKARDFVQRYKRTTDEISRIVSHVNWMYVAEQYKGIEIPDIRLLKSDNELNRVQWIYGWDCDCGCIWDLSVIKNTQVVDCTGYDNTFDPYGDY